MPDCTCPKHRLRDAIYKAIEGFTNRKASMTLVAFGVILLVVFLGGRFPTIDGNLPTILGAVVGALTAFLGGHIFDAKWSPPSGVARIESKDLPAVAKVMAKDVAKDEQEEGS
jgi:hypothetical protein